MPTLRYIGPIDEVDVVGVGVFKRGDEFEVTAEAAGSAPAWRKPEKDEDVTRLHQRGADASLEVLDLGSGLLAQSDNFAVATKKKG